jgi:hypothetical protein
MIHLWVGSNFYLEQAMPAHLRLIDTNEKIGSLLYAAVTTRPDIAFTASRLARFLTNPGQEHQDAADRALLYLKSTRTRALQLGGENDFEVANDASFADNTTDRKSFQGYTIRLFGGQIAWKATKQNTVTTSTTEAELAGEQILDCRWVYTYKLDKHHRLIKCKARLVGRGDQQRDITAQDTYAATLAGRSFRLLMSISAHDAFVHAGLDRKVYMRIPYGYAEKGYVYKLQKALYGLRISPLLWQQELTQTLHSLGFKEVPHKPCCMMKDGILLFYYVDDIIVASHPGMAKEKDCIVAQLQKKYTITGGDDLQWFLGMEVIRDREKRLIWLSQEAYVDKISRLIDNHDIRHDTPMSSAELKPRESLATLSEINKYQRKIGSLLYAAVTTRTDISFTTSRLARFLVNPDQSHPNLSTAISRRCKVTISPLRGWP